MRTVRSIAILTVLLLGSSQVSQAQRPNPTSLARLHPSQFVRVETPALGRVQGSVAANSRGELRLFNGTEQVIPIADIQRAWIRGGRTRLGALIGGVLGAGGGIFLGVIINAVCEGDCNGSVVAATVLGAGVGAGTGAIIGAAIPHWSEID